MIELLIPIGIGVFALGMIIYLNRNVTVEKEPKQIHEVRKITFVVSDKPEVEKPKRKKKKYYNRKKKPVVAESAPAAPIVKRPVGRPRKTVD